MSISSNASVNSISAGYVISNPNQQNTLANTLINSNTSNNIQFGINTTTNITNGITSVAFMDELVKEYLLYRGCNVTFKSFEHDLKQDRERAFKADKIVEQLFAYINSYDLINLIEYWSYLDQKYFSHLTFKTLNGTPLSRKYELFLFRYYLVHSIQTNKIDKVNEFFEKLTPFIQTQPEWKDWFCLPFIKNPEENATFAIYFNQKWIDTFAISLQNFISIVFQSVQFPRLLLFDEDAYWNANSGRNLSVTTQSTYNDTELLNQELTDEFQLMQSDTPTSSSTLPSSGNSFISILKNLGASNTRNKTNTTNSNQLKQSTNGINNNISNQQLSEAKQLPLISPLENLMKNIKLNNQQKTDNKKDANESENKNNLPVIESANKQQLAEKQIEINNEDSKIKIIIEKPKERENTLVQVSQITENNLSKSELTIKPYTILNKEDYLEHKDAIIHCKHSPDGTYVASVDTNGILKIWSLDQSIDTLSTLIQKSMIISMEWDKRNNNILYLGNNSSIVKVYNVIEKKIVQELIHNKLYPNICQICSFASNDKLLIISSVQALNSKSEIRRECGHLVICKINSLTNLVSIEKTIDLETYFSQCVIPYLSNYALLGCTDGQIRIFDCNSNSIINSRKCHTSNVLNIAINKGQTKLYSLSNDNQIKIWLLNNTFLHSTTTQNALNTFKLPFDMKLEYNYMINQDNQQLINYFNSFMALDLCENLIFLANKNGVLLFKMMSSLLKLNKLNTNDDSSGTSISNNDLEEVEKFSCSNVTTIELWHSTYSCVLLAGCLDGKINVFRLLNN